MTLMAKRTLLLLLLIFTVCTFKLCAETMTPAKAQVARESFIEEAKKYVGAPYVYGSIGPDTFDCSGYVYYVAQKSLNIQLPRTSKALYSYCRIVSDRDREIGDLLFFKTTGSGSISHVGIYLGNNKFISALSDGPNSGVVISSLNQDYWKTRYVSAGQFLSTGTKNDVITPEFEEEYLDEGSDKETKVADSNYGYIADWSGYINWSLISPNEFSIQFRGVDIQSNIRATKIPLQPGIGLNLRINQSLGIFQMPILLSTTINDYLRIYAGPVLSFGRARLLNSSKEIQASVFPGIIGVSLSTPHFEIGKVKLQFAQDLSYTVFNNTDNAALSFFESMAAGLLLNTGVKVSYEF